MFFFVSSMCVSPCCNTALSCAISFDVVSFRNMDFTYFSSPMFLACAFFSCFLHIMSYLYRKKITVLALLFFKQTTFFFSFLDFKDFFSAFRIGFYSHCDRNQQQQKIIRLQCSYVSSKIKQEEKSEH